MFSSIGPWELILILLVALIVVGPGKLPEVAKSLGKSLNDFKKATSGVKKEFQDAINTEFIADKQSQNLNGKSDEEPVDLAAILNNKVISPLDGETPGDDPIDEKTAAEEKDKQPDPDTPK